MPRTGTAKKRTQKAYLKKKECTTGPCDLKKDGSQTTLEKQDSLFASELALFKDQRKARVARAPRPEVVSEISREIAAASRLALVGCDYDRSAAHGKLRASFPVLGLLSRLGHRTASPSWTERLRAGRDRLIAGCLRETSHRIARETSRRSARGREAADSCPTTLVVQFTAAVYGAAPPKVGVEQPDVGRRYREDFRTEVLPLLTRADSRLGSGRLRNTRCVRLDEALEGVARHPLLALAGCSRNSLRRWRRLGSDLQALVLAYLEHGENVLPCLPRQHPWARMVTLDVVCSLEHWDTFLWGVRLLCARPEATLSMRADRRLEQELFRHLLCVGDRALAAARKHAYFMARTDAAAEAREAVESAKRDEAAREARAAARAKAAAGKRKRRGEAPPAAEARLRFSLPGALRPRSRAAPVLVSDSE